MYYLFISVIELDIEELKQLILWQTYFLFVFISLDVVHVVLLRSLPLGRNRVLEACVINHGEDPLITNVITAKQNRGDGCIFLKRFEDVGGTCVSNARTFEAEKPE